MPQKSPQDHPKIAATPPKAAPRPLQEPRVQEQRPTAAEHRPNCPKTTQEYLRPPQDRPTTAQDRPKRLQEHPKTSPRRPKIAIILENCNNHGTKNKQNQHFWAPPSGSTWPQGDPRSLLETASARFVYRYDSPRLGPLVGSYVVQQPFQACWQRLSAARSVGAATLARNSLDLSCKSCSGRLCG